MCLIAAAVAAAIGWTTIAGTVVWYRVVVVPELYVGDSIVPFVLVVTIGALAFLAVFVGALRRTWGRGDGLPMMVIGAFALVAIIFSSLTTTGVLLIPGFLIATLAASLPPTRPWAREAISEPKQ